MFLSENVHPGYRAGPPSHMNTSNFFTKEIGVKRDLGNRAIPVNRDHMKRPSGSKTA